MPAGRPKGLPRTGGRKPGTPNKATVEVRTLAQQYGPKALQTLAKIMADTKEVASARVSAAKEILDRAYGKSPQPIAVNATNIADVFADLIDRLPG